MRNPFNGSLHIGLSRTRVTVLRRTGWRQPRASVVADMPLTEDLAESPAYLNDMLATVLPQEKCTYLPTRIVLADELTRLFMVTPPHNPERRQDLFTAASLRFRTLYDEPLSNWEVSADWNIQNPFLACAIPQSLFGTLCALGKQHRLPLVEIAPQFTVAANRWKRNVIPGSWIGVIANQTLTIGAYEQGKLCAIRRTSIPENTQHHQWLAEYVGREALRLNLPMPAHMQLYGDFSADFLSQQTGAPACTRLGDFPAEPAGITAGIMLVRTGVC